MGIRKLIQRELACRRLQKLVEAKRQSFEVRDFAKRREAALKFTRQVGT